MTGWWPTARALEHLACSRDYLSAMMHGDAVTRWHKLEEVALRFGVSKRRLRELMRATTTGARPWVWYSEHNGAFVPDAREHDEWFARISKLIVSGEIRIRRHIAPSQLRSKAARRGMPKAPEIVSWWFATMPWVCAGKCFACDAGGTLDRAHILPIIQAGSNAPENLHMLCHACHVASERLTGEAYWTWFRSRRP